MDEISNLERNDRRLNTRFLFIKMHSFRKRNEEGMNNWFFLLSHYNIITIL